MNERDRLSRRAFSAFALAGAAGFAAPAAAAPRVERDDLAADVGAMLMLGFYGATAESPTARALAAAIADGRAAGAFFVKQNIGERADVEKLVRLFRDAAKAPPLIAVDHEGGAVQRLTSRHGFADLPPARFVAAEHSPEAARSLYARAARDLAAVGFTLNLAPVVDVHDPDNPAIGHFNRAFDADPERVALYAAAFVDGFAAAGVACAPKHFPGYGRALIDSHRALPDVTRGWAPSELTPYARLIAGGRARIVMGGHMRLATVEADGLPATLSPAIMTGLLRRGLGFQGVAMTDDIDMTAVSRGYSRREAFVRAIAAGADVVMIRNATPPDPHLTLNAVVWAREAIARGELRREAASAAAAKVRALRAGLGAATL